MVCNENNGGTFAAQAVGQPFDAMVLGKLSFDYRITPEAKVNILLETDDAPYIIEFTGGPELTPGQIYLGKIANVVADGQWHHAEFDLRGHVYREHPRAERFIVKRVLFGQFSRNKPLLCGLTGNPARATYYIDNFGLFGPGGMRLVARVEGEDAEIAELSYVIDQQPNTVPDEVPESDRPEIELTDPSLAGGMWYLHVRGLTAEGSWTRPVHYAFLVDADRPIVGALDPPEGTPCDGGEVRLALRDETSGINPRKLRVLLADETYTTADEALSYDPVAGVLRFDLSRAKRPLPEGQPLRLQLVGVEDYAGYRPAVPKPYTVVIDHALDKTPPPAPTIMGEARFLCNDTFERREFDQWQGFDRPDGAVLALDTSTAASGRGSLLLYMANPPYGTNLVDPDPAEEFGTWVRTAPFNAGKFRLLSFDYKVPDYLRVHWLLKLADGQGAYIAFTDNDKHKEFPEIGRFPEITPDNKWHHTQFDLYQALKKTFPGLSDYTVQRLWISGVQFEGNSKDTRYNIDNFRLAPVVAARDGVLHIEWTAHDPSGISAASYVLDQKPNTVPDTEPETTENFAEVVGDFQGLYYFHVRVRDGAGNWGPPTHHPLLVDSAPVVAKVVAPQPGARVCTTQIKFRLADAGISGVDPSTIRVRIAGKEYDLRSPALRYDANTGELEWEGQRVEPDGVSFADGQRVVAELISARDFAGNPLPKPARTEFTMDYSLDNEPPPAPTVTSDTHRTALFVPFEESLAGLRGTPKTDVALDHSTASSGKASARVRNQGSALFGCVLRLSQPFDARDYPYFEFDYKATPDCRVDIVFVVGNRKLPIAFLDGEGEQYGKVRDAAADGKWHHATVDLLTAVQRMERITRTEVTMIGFFDRGKPNTALGATLWLDNLFATKPAAGECRFRFVSHDRTGIRGYSYVFDRNPDTIPDDKLEGKQVTFVAPPLADEREKGPWYFHVRAQDGSGKWSRTTHYGIIRR